MNKIAYLTSCYWVTIDKFSWWQWKKLHSDILQELEYSAWNEFEIDMQPCVRAPAMDQQYCEMVACFKYKETRFCL